ncbi:unnamed protein product, partial [Ectocarpus sp. 13 AM-2016]
MRYPGCRAHEAIGLFTTSMPSDENPTPGVPGEGLVNDAGIDTHHLCCLAICVVPAFNSNNLRNIAGIDGDRRLVGGISRRPELFPLRPGETGICPHATAQDF